MSSFPRLRNVQRGASAASWHPTKRNEADGAAFKTRSEHIYVSIDNSELSAAAP